MHKQYSLSGSLLLGLVLAAGTAIVWGVVVLVCSVAILLASLDSPDPVFDEHLSFDAEEGTPLIGWRSRSDSRLRYRTLDGEQTEGLGQFQTSRLRGPEGVKQLDVPVEWSRRIFAASDHELAPEYWYLIHDGRPDGHTWLEGFDSVTRQRMGYIGRHGFQNAPPTSDDLFPINWPAFQASVVSTFWGRFGYQPSLLDWRPGPERIPPWIGYVVTDGKLVEIDVREHSVRTLLEDPRIVSASVVSHLSTDATVSESAIRRFVAVRSADRLWIVDPHTDQSHDLLIPDSWADLPYLGILLVDDQIVLTNESWPQTDPVMLVWLTQDGRVLQERSVSLRTDVFPKPGVWAQVVAVPVPIVVVLNILVGDPLNELYGTVRAAHVEAMTASWRRWRGPFAAICLLSIALAVWCFWRHRRNAQPGAWVWCVFVLLLGVPGLIGYLLHRRWPVRETCPACGRPAVVDRETCQHCGAPFPTPTLQGIEVFA
jgi:hypothetical protein